MYFFAAEGGDRLSTILTWLPFLEGNFPPLTSLPTPAHFASSHTESQNHRIVGVGRDLCGSSSPTPCSFPHFRQIAGLIRTGQGLADCPPPWRRKSLCHCKGKVSCPRSHGKWCQHFYLFSVHGFLECKLTYILPSKIKNSFAFKKSL